MKKDCDGADTATVELMIASGRRGRRPHSRPGGRRYINAARQKWRILLTRFARVL